MSVQFPRSFGEALTTHQRRQLDVAAERLGTSRAHLMRNAWDEYMMLGAAIDKRDVVELHKDAKNRFDNRFRDEKGRFVKRAS